MTNRRRPYPCGGLEVTRTHARTRVTQCPFLVSSIKSSASHSPTTISHLGFQWINLQVTAQYVKGEGSRQEKLNPALKNYTKVRIVRATLSVRQRIHAWIASALVAHSDRTASIYAFVSTFLSPRKRVHVLQLQFCYFPLCRRNCGFLIPPPEKGAIFSILFFFSWTRCTKQSRHQPVRLCGDWFTTATLFKCLCLSLAVASKKLGKLRYQNRMRASYGERKDIIRGIIPARHNAITH